jgi:signal transduction histidine kinase
MNLLGNSLKYTPAGYIHVRLELGEKTSAISGDKESYVYLSVEDTGCGISEDFMDNHLYKPFHQENPLKPGTGLGLSIVRQLVDSINGTIRTKSEVCNGTLISVTASIVRPEIKSIPSLPKLSLDPALHGRRVGFYRIRSAS